MTSQVNIDPLNNLKKEKKQLDEQLFFEIDQRVNISNFTFNCFSSMKKQLEKHEQKSNKNGLSGSLFFKLSK